ncbi:MAG: hypothetical protein ACHQLQ_10655 [Candidatus Acidiferrales bacterium]
MSGAATQRVTRREICGKHGIEFGQLFTPSSPGRESFWTPAVCRECEADIRREQQAAEELEKQTAEIAGEVEKRIAADSQFKERVRAAAAADLAEELQKEVARFCAEWRPQFEEYRYNFFRNEIVAQVEEEKRAEFLERSRKAS